MYCPIKRYLESMLVRNQYGISASRYTIDRICWSCHLTLTHDDMREARCCHTRPISSVYLSNIIHICGYGYTAWLVIVMDVTKHLMWLNSPAT